MDGTIRVLQVGMTNNIGGVETYLMTQYRNINRNKVTYDFINIQKNNVIAFEDEIRNFGGKIYSVTARRLNPLFHYVELFMLLYRIRKQYQALIINICTLDYVYPILVAKILGIPIRVVHAHNAGNETGESMIRQWLRWINWQVVKFSATNYWACSELAGTWMFKGKSFFIIHNAIQTDLFLYDEKIRSKIRSNMHWENQFVIGNVARISVQKNQLFLIEIFASILEKRQNSILVFVGDYEFDANIYAKLKDKISELNLNEKIFFLGLRNDVNLLYQGMDCVVMPSLFEGLCITAIEAQASGLPCVCSDKMSLETAITPLYKSTSLQSSAESWAENILNMESMHRKDMKQEIVEAGYDIATEIRLIEEFYEQRIYHFE